MSNAEHIASVLGGEKVLGMQVNTLAQLEALVSKGLPKESLRSAARRVAGNRSEVRAIIHQFVPESTFKRRGPLSAQASERAERLARIVSLAEHTWGDTALAHEWLRTPNRHLDDRSPLQATRTELGARQVELVILRAVHGIPD